MVNVTSTISYITLNINSVNASIKRKKLSELIKKAKT